MLLLELGHGVFDQVVDAFAPRPPIMIHQQIARHAGEPRWKRSERGPVARESAVDAQEDFLAQVLGFRRVAGEPITQAKNAPRVAPHKFLPGRPLAPETLLYQLGVGLQSLLASQAACPSRPHSIERIYQPKSSVQCPSSDAPARIL